MAKLLAVLNERIAAEADAERKGRLANLGEGLAAAGRDVVIGVLTPVLSTGGPVIGGGS